MKIGMANLRGGMSGTIRGAVAARQKRLPPFSATPRGQQLTATTNVRKRQRYFGPTELFPRLERDSTPGDAHMAGSSVLEIPKMHGIGDARFRVPESQGKPLPAGTVVVSADSHWLEGDIWVDRFPEHLKDRAPRVFFENGGWELEIGGVRLTPPGTAAASCSFECVPGFNNLDVRMKDLDTEGVNQEILFPQKFFNLLFLESLEEKEWCARAYNQALSEFTAGQPDRLHGVAIMNWWDPDQARDAVAEIKALGFKTAMVPIQPGKYADGELINYHSERMEPFWAAIEDAGLPLCFHIGERPVNPATSPRGAAGIFVMQQMGGMRNIWSTLTFGGVFDRNPGLQVIFVESGLHWVPGALQEADMIYESFPSHVQPKLSHMPSHYWFDNCYATFMVDPAGLEMIHRVGANNAMWSSDYPHNESTLGYTRSAVQAVFDATSVEDAKKIVGGNAVRVFGLR
jgi:predicted TIM-barrel fold metal-dependent hydrolase